MMKSLNMLEFEKNIEHEKNILAVNMKKYFFSVTAQNACKYTFHSGLDHD